MAISSTPSGNDIKTLRFTQMDKVGESMVHELNRFQEYFRQLRVFEEDGIEHYCLDFIRQKIGNKPLRAYFWLKALEYLEFYDTTKAPLNRVDKVLLKTKLPFVFEIVICIQYLHNHILDEKYDSKPTYHTKVCQNLIASNIIREVLFLYLEEEVKPRLPNQNEYNALNAAIRRLLVLVDVGQRMDKSFTNYEHWKKGISPVAEQSDIFDQVFHEAIDATVARVKEDIPEKSAFIDAYFRRIYLTNVYLFRCMTDTLVRFSDATAEPCLKFRRFTVQYGFMIQIINDYSDFAYDENENLETAAKKTTDVFSDLYNFNITLPLIYHLKEGERRRILGYLEGGIKRRSIISDYPVQVMQEIVESGSIRACVAITRTLAKSAISHLDQNNPAYTYLSNMCDMAYVNKFYRILK